ncbi:hypothetical protein [Clostridium botulinum]|nr:hypothetical protein [Clostridium botulinum]
MTELDKVADIDCSYELIECRDSLEDISDFFWYQYGRRNGIIEILDKK